MYLLKLSIRLSVLGKCWTSIPVYYLEFVLLGRNFSLVPTW